MEPIRDLTWMAQKAFGTLERFTVYGYSAVAVEIAVKAPAGSPRSPSKPRGGYKFRLLFFPPQQSRPVYAINLEASILGDWVVSEEDGSAHRVVERLAGPLGYEDFRIKALERAMRRLSAAAGELGEKGKKIENNAQVGRGLFR